MTGNVAEPSFRFESVPGSDTVYIGFAGFQLDRTVPDFSWGRAFSTLPVNRLLVRDIVQFWYLRGLANLGPDIEQSAVALRKMLADHGITHIVSVGASIGGFAAILYGSLLGADEVIAFGPMTRLPSRPISDTVRNVTRGNMPLARKQIGLRLHLLRGHDHRYRDLRPFLQNDNGRTRYHIIYGQDHTADRTNAERLQDVPRVTLDPRPFSKHDLVRDMRESGELATLLSESYSHLAASP